MNLFRTICLGSAVCGVTFIAQTAFAGTCVDLQTNLSRGAESSNVLLLQTFLAGKGFLSVKPNGYFGPSTFTAVKAYQKSIGLSPVGNTGPATRAALKKESCANGATPATVQSTVSVQQASVATPQVVAQGVSQVQSNPYIKPPFLSSMDLVTLFAGGVRDWATSLYGMNFSTSTASAVYFQNRNSPKKYLVVSATSSDGMTLVIPEDVTSKALSCGTDCSELLPVGDYDIVVVSNGLESNTLFMSVKGFTLSAKSGAETSAILSNAKNARIGTLYFAANVPTLLIRVTPKLVPEGITMSNITDTRLKDEVAGATLSTSGVEMNTFQSGVVGLYGDFDAIVPGSVTTSFSVTVMDYIGKKYTTFTSPSVLVTINPY